jgi:hypothetical protein
VKFQLYGLRRRVAGVLARWRSDAPYDKEREQKFTQLLAKVQPQTKAAATSWSHVPAAAQSCADGSKRKILAPAAIAAARSVSEII